MDEGPKIAFFGTSYYSTRMLDYLKEEGLTPSMVVAAPDKPKGRKLVMTPPPVKEWAIQNDVKFIQPESLKVIPEELSSTEWDLFIVVSYGKILTKEILDMPERGVLNVHPSLLPKFRGASPIQSAILADAQETGVTIMLLDEEMDHGPIVSQASTYIEDWPPSFSILEDLLASVGGELLVETVLPWINGDIKEEGQNHAEATYVTKIKKEDGLLDLNADPYRNFLKIQAFEEWPGTYFFVKQGGKDVRVKIVEAIYENNALKIERVIPEGKKEMDYSDFMRNIK
jgi:methionyl-tRNA formyltransferase